MRPPHQPIRSNKPYAPHALTSDGVSGGASRIPKRGAGQAPSRAPSYPPAHAPSSGGDEGWQSISQWYDQCVGAQGHFYHRELILPNLQRSLKLQSCSSLLDLGCGQGVLERMIPATCRYMGIDASAQLLQSAKKQARNPEHRFTQADLNHPQRLNETFDLALFILSLQNMEKGEIAIQTAAHHLSENGQLALVLNHPCFRIPRQSEWVENQGRKTLMRCLHGYLSPQQIPIQTHPGQDSEQSSISYHHSLSHLFKWIQQAGLKVTHLDEWAGSKVSTGSKARMENRARQEFPLFLYLVASR